MSVNGFSTDVLNENENDRLSTGFFNIIFLLDFVCKKKTKNNIKYEFVKIFKE